MELARSVLASYVNGSTCVALCDVVVRKTYADARETGKAAVTLIIKNILPQDTSHEDSSRKRSNRMFKKLTKLSLSLKMVEDGDVIVSVCGRWMTAA